MSLSRETLLDLMGFADGELEGEARERTEKLVASSDEARRVVQAMREGLLGAWLGDITRDRAVAAGADGVADAVMARAAALRSEAARVASSPLASASIGDARARRAARVRGALGAGVGALALAAGVAVYLHTEATRSGSPVATGPSAPLLEAPSMTATALAQGGPAIRGVEVDEIDSPSHGVSVFEIPMGAAAAAASPGHAASVVIWIEDEPGVQ